MNVTYRIRTLQYTNGIVAFVLENSINRMAWEWLISTQDKPWLLTWLKKARIKVDRKENITENMEENQP